MSRATLVFVLTLLLACDSGSVAPEPEPEPTASLELSTSTRGAPPDPDGYRLVVDAGESMAMATNDTLSLPEVTTGEHRIELTDLAENCMVSGPNPRTVVAAAGAVTKIRLEVLCSATTGSLTVEVATGGIHPDLDGYVVTANGAEQPIASNGSLTVPDLPPGTVEVGLAGVAPNCQVSGDNPRTVPVTSGATAVVAFAVQCAGSSEGRLLVTSDRGRHSHLYRLSEDGSDLVDLTPSQEAFDGDWSPDGSRIVFGGAGADATELYVMNADGSGVTALGIVGSGPRWSPDGGRIAFTGTDGVALVNSDGTDRLTLGDGRHPAWSPDGTRIVFDRIDRSRCVFDIACPVELFVMASDGAGVRRLTTANNISDEMMNPRWSPDGSAIAYTRRCCFLGADVSGVYAVSASGGLAHRVYPGPVRGSPVWAPDASGIAVAVPGLNGTTDILAVPRAGGRETLLLATPGSDYPQAWR